MRSRLKYIATLGLLCLPQALHAEGEIGVLAKTWQVGYTAKNAQQQLAEYVLPGQTVNDWRELVSRQLFFDPSGRVPIGRLVELIRGGFGSDCKDFKWTVVRQSETEVLYAWSHTGCSKYPAQAELSRITRAPKGVCRWAYATKEPPIAAAAQSQIDLDLAKQSCD